MAKIVRKGRKMPKLDQFKLSRFYPNWNPGDAFGLEDQTFPDGRKELRRDDIEEEIRDRISKEELRWKDMVEQAHARGVKEGLQEGKKQGHQEIEPVLELMRQWVAVLDAEKTEFFSNLEESLLKLAVFITEKIIAREIRQDPKIVRNLVSSALARVSHGGKIIIRVNSDDMETVQSMSLPELLPQGTAGDIVIEADNSVGRGGCLIETPGGIIDAQIQTQLEELCKEIYGEEQAVTVQSQEQVDSESPQEPETDSEHHDAG
jgi:flagellar assembly protein FliH